ncbi:unnamed protein product [Nippostrongylus brasiliensis]|uniref:PDZ domain-containing protein n=1 Tax=Nippostrongylus brasiliensis TaxID=27835 RepID=A0A0N4XH02_NIPBR|nr:unnamed protein product [Nippostrongylus brasiliensis]
MSTTSAVSRKRSGKEQLASSLVEHTTTLLMDFLGERRQSQHSVAPLTFPKGHLAFHGKSRVAQLVARLEKVPLKKPPLAEPEVVDTFDEQKKVKRKYAKHLTSTKILSSIFRRDEEKKAAKTASVGKVVALTGAAVREPMILRERRNGSLGCKVQSPNNVFPTAGNFIRARRSEGCIKLTGVENEKKPSTVAASLGESQSQEREKSSTEVTAPKVELQPERPLKRRPYNTIGGGPLMRRHRGRRFEDSTIGSESDARMFSDDDDSYLLVSFGKSSLFEESSMSLDVDTVILNMDTVNFLGISIVGQSSARGDNGIYVANIMKGGAVALDGRISAGDMILQVNDISFDNFTNDQAVDVLR